MRNRQCKKRQISVLGLLCILLLAGCSRELKNAYEDVRQAAVEIGSQIEEQTAKEDAVEYDGKLKLSDIPAYAGEPYIVLKENRPDFTKEEKTTQCFEKYSQRDSLNRCKTAYANVCQKLMPEEKRKGIGHIRPSGWHTVKYDCVDGKYLYNRCHLIGFQLTGENANANNLITGTRYMNVEGMLPFEDEIAAYVKETDYHVLYRVTPHYEGDNLLASGVELEAFSVEDKGKGICFHVYVYNVQPGVEIDYATGESCLESENN